MGSGCSAGPYTSLCALCLFYQNAEILSSLDSASLHIFKPPPTFLSAAAPRFQASGPLQTSTPPALNPTPVLGPFIPAPETPRMATIQEDPSYDSPLDEQVLEEDFSSGSTAARSFEDLTRGSPASAVRSDKAKSFRLQRQARLNSKETVC